MMILNNLVEMALPDPLLFDGLRRINRTVIDKMMHNEIIVCVYEVP